MHAMRHAANVQDRDGGVWLMAVLFARYPFLVKLTPMADTRDLSSDVRSKRSCGA